MKSINENYADIETTLYHPLITTIILALSLPLLTLCHTAFISLIDILTTQIDCASKLNVKKILNKFESKSSSIDESLTDENESLTNELNFIKGRISNLAPLLIKTELPIELLEKRLNQIDICKLKILVYLFETHDDDPKTIEDLCSELSSTDKETIQEILTDLEAESLIECYDIDGFHHDAEVLLTDDGKLEIASIKAEVLKQEFDFGNGYKVFN